MTDLIVALWLLSSVPICWAASRATLHMPPLGRWVALLMLVAFSWLGAMLALGSFLPASGGQGGRLGMLVLSAVLLAPLVWAFRRAPKPAKPTAPTRPNVGADEKPFWLDRPEVRASMQKVRDRLSSEQAVERSRVGARLARSGYSDEIARNIAASNDAAVSMARAAKPVPPPVAVRIASRPSMGGYFFNYAKPGEAPEQRHATFTSFSIYGGSVYLNGDDHDRYDEERSFKVSRIKGKFTDADTGEMVTLRTVKRGLPETSPSFGASDDEY